MPEIEGFAARLREVRLEARYDQTSFARLGGAQKNSQIDYEAARTAPKVDYLFNLAQHGVDIGYVLTGQRSSGDLGFGDQLVLDLFARLSAREREAVMTLLMNLAGQTVPLDSLVRPGTALHDRKSEFKGAKE